MGAEQDKQYTCICTLHTDAHIPKKHSIFFIVPCPDPSKTTNKRFSSSLLK